MKVGTSVLVRLLLTSACLLAAKLAAQTPIVGTFKYPDGTPLTGKLTVSITRPTINDRNLCTGTHYQIATRPVTVNVVGGSMGSLSLLGGPCMVVSAVPTVTLGAGAGVGAHLNSVTSTDLQATIGFTTGTGPVAGAAVLSLALGNGPYTPQPACILSGLATATNSRVSTTKNSITISATLAASTSYTVEYYCQLVPYLVKVYDNKNNLIYTGHWVVPDSASAVNASTLDIL